MDKETQQTRLDPIQGQSTGVQYRNIEVEQHKRPYMEHVEVGQQRVVKQDVKDGQNGQLAPQGVTITGEQQNISSQPLGFNGLKAYNTHMYASQQAAQAHKLYKEQMAQRQAQAQPQAQPQPHNVQPSQIKLEHQVQQQLAPHEIVKQRQAVQPSSGQQISPELARHPAMPSVQQAEKLQPVPSVPTTNTTAVEEKKRHAELPVRAYLDQTVVPIIVSGLVELVRSRPEDPVKWLANYLLAHNPQKSYNQPRLP